MMIRKLGYIGFVIVLTACLVGMWGLGIVLFTAAPLLGKVFIVGMVVGFSFIIVAVGCDVMRAIAQESEL